MSRPATSPPESRAPSAAGLSDRMSTRRGNNAWHEVLDLCKHGFGNKMESISEEIIRDIRSEVHEAVSSFRREASSATLASDRPIGTQLVRVEDRLQKVEKLVTNLPPPDFASVHQTMKDVETSCLSACQQLAERLDQISRANSQIRDKLHSSEGNVCEQLQRFEQKMLRLEDCLQRLDKAGEVVRLQQSLQGSTSQIVGEVQKLQQQEDQHFAALDRTCADAGVKVKKGLDELSNMSSQISDQINTSGTNVSHLLQRIENVVKKSETKLSDVEHTQLALKDTIANEVAKVQRQDDRHYTDVNLYLETSRSENRVQLEDVQNTLRGFHFDLLLRDITRDRVRQTVEYRTVLGELAKVQQALNVEYLRVGDLRLNRDGLDNQEFEAMVKEIGIAQPSPKRVREFFTQTVTKDKKDIFAQTDPVILQDQATIKKKRKASHRKAALMPERKVKPAFAGADKLKQAAKEASMMPPYNVFDYYHEDGLSSYIARSAYFENLSLLVVIVNAVWIAVDTDLNTAPLLIQSKPIFVVMENVFCSYFTFELAVRFCAFQTKKNAFKDAWFVFDLCLVLMMIVETWVLTAIMLALDLQLSAESSGMSLLRMVKMVKLIRLSRMARLLRSVPELIIIIKGLRFAARSVTVFFLLWGMIVYIFAVVFRQITDGWDIGAEYFSSVPAGMNTLLLNGVFADSASLVFRITKGNYILWPLIVFFMALVSLTLMYMLVGVLVDVVSVVATSEKEGLAVSHIASQLREQLQALGYKDDMELTQQEFHTIMLDHGVLKVVQSVNVDVTVLADMLDMLFEQFSKGAGTLGFPDLVDMILSMRGSNPATVKDCKEQIRVTKHLLKETVEEVIAEVRQELHKVEGGYGRDGSTDSEGELS